MALKKAVRTARHPDRQLPPTPQGELKGGGILNLEQNLMVP